MKVRDLRGWDAHLVELAWELNDLGFDSVVRFPPGRRPSLEIFLPPEPRRGRMAQRDRTLASSRVRQCDRRFQDRVRGAFEWIAKTVAV
ncbi:hypothetical protein [Streptosporangium sp. NPDC006007]|uniref:hypothetical protein n=1 Tax=Streptosporangium sp. NPDC006007 TaxID=3154575 RepID=UPI0033B97D5C